MQLAVLLLSVTDEPRATTVSSEWVRGAMARAAQYFTDQSGGREALQFEVFDWFQLPVTSAEWNGWGFDAGRHARPLVSDSLGVDLDSFDRYLLIIDKADARLAALAPDGVHIYMSGQDMDPALICHELGHIYGAGHANLDSANGPVEYADNFCVMGGEGVKFSFTDPLVVPKSPDGEPLTQFATSGPGMAASTLQATSWLSLSDPAVAVDLTDRLNGVTPFEVELAALHGSPPPGHAGPPVVAYATQTAGQSLTIEYRFPSGWDSGIPRTSVPGQPTTGFVVLHLAAGSSSLQIGAIEATPESVIEHWKAGAKVAVVAVDPGRETVRLRIERTAMTPPPPPPDPCADIRREFGVLRRQLMMFQLGRSDAPQPKIDEIFERMEQLRSLFRDKGCPGDVI